MPKLAVLAPKSRNSNVLLTHAYYSSDVLPTGLTYPKIITP